MAKMKPPGEQYDFFIASHVLTDGPAQALRDYLVARKKSLVFAACPLSDATMPRAEIGCYLDGEKTKEYRGHQHHQLKGARLWLKDAGFIWKWGWRLAHKRTLFIGVNNLNACVGIWLRKLRRCGKVIYYVIDYTPQRFKSKIINTLYQVLARYAAKNADQVWSLSERMREVHSRFGTRKEANLLVPIGIDPASLQVLPADEIASDRLVVVSTLYPNKGVQLAIEALIALPQARLVIVGTGPYHEALQTLAQKIGVASRVQFLGLLSRRQLFNEVAKSRVAIATYVPEAGNYTYFADPAKPKEYLACGVPVVITRVPWIAELIDKKPMGISINYEVKELAAACQRLMVEQTFWRKCRENALLFTRELNWTTIYNQALKI